MLKPSAPSEVYLDPRLGRDPWLISQNGQEVYKFIFILFRSASMTGHTQFFNGRSAHQSGLRKDGDVGVMLREVGRVLLVLFVVSMVQVDQSPCKG